MPKKSSGSGGHEIPLWGIVLFFVGVVLLLMTLGIIPWRVWSTLVDFWPVLVIIAGLYILLRHSHAWMATFIILGLLFLSLGIAVWQYGPEPVSANSRTFSQPAAGISQGKVTVNFAAGQLAISALPAGAANLAEEVSQTAAGIEAEFANNNGVGTLTINRQRGDHDLTIEADWIVKLSSILPIDLTVKSAAGQADIKLGSLKISKFDIEQNAGKAAIETPISGQGEIRVNAAAVDVTIPAGVAARIKSTTSIGAIDINSARFQRQGDYYLTEGYDTALVRLDLALQCNVGRITVK